MVDVRSLIFERAVEEVRRAGLFERNPLLADLLISLISVMCNSEINVIYYPLVVDLFNKLMGGEVLSPLTSDMDEWEDIGDGLLRNKRFPTAFSTREILLKGKAWRIDGILWKSRDGRLYYNERSVVWFDLPGYPPPTEICKEEIDA